MERASPTLGTQTRTTGNRAVARVADAFIVLVPSIFIWQLLGGVSLLWSYVLLTLGYHVYFEATYGQTIGKRSVDIVVVGDDGEPCTWTAAGIRNVIRLVDSIMFYLVGLIFILTTAHNQRLGDLLAGTIVTETGDEPPSATNGQKNDEAAFTMKVHHDDESGERYIELINETTTPVDLSRGTLMSETGSRFRFPHVDATQKPGSSVTILLPRDFSVDHGTALTVVTRRGDEYRVAWASGD